MKLEYMTQSIRSGGEDGYDIGKEMTQYGDIGWEFCSWVSDWEWNEGPGPDRRVALFKRWRAQ